MDVASELYSSVFQSIPVALCAVDRQGRILLANPALEQLLGWSLAELSQQSLVHCLQEAIVDPGQALCWKVAFHEALALDKKTCLDIPAPFRVQGRDGEERLLSGMVMPYRHEGIKPFGALAIFYPQEPTESLEAVRERLVGAISHETWSPISNISLAAELLARHLDPDNPEQWRLLRIVRAEVIRMQRLVAQFLSPADNARIKSAAPSQVVTLRPLIQQTARTFSLAETGHRVIVEVPESLPFVLGDAETIQEILAHLVDHGLRHARPGAQIAVAAQAHSHEVWVSVGGAGGYVGLPAQRRQAQSEAQPLQDTKSPLPDGQDLGLSIARSLVQAMGGEIWCDELPDGSLRFCFSLRRALEVPDD
jgi:PAS domain S-box-containing protein